MKQLSGGSRIKNKLCQVEKGRFWGGGGWELKSSAEGRNPAGSGDARRRQKLGENSAPFPWKSLSKSRDGPGFKSEAPEIQ